MLKHLSIGRIHHQVKQYLGLSPEPKKKIHQPLEGSMIIIVFAGWW